MEKFRLSVVYNDKNQFVVEFEHYDKYVHAVCKISGISEKLQEGSFKAKTLKDFYESFQCCAEELQKNFW